MTTAARQLHNGTDYLHGYSIAEQQRLVRQAAYWRENLIRTGMKYEPGERVLEIGCGAAATLGEIIKISPGIIASGVDVEPSQIAFAREHLQSLGFEADLRVGNGGNLPWEEGSFDHVYIMWLLEHLKDSTGVLREAQRVLRPGGRITITETDYTCFKVTPCSAEWDYFENAQYQFFAQHGNPIVGRQLGVLLGATGFKKICNWPVGFHYFYGGGGLREHVDYVIEFLEPAVPKIALLGFDESRLRKGVEYLASIPNCPSGSLTNMVYRAHGAKAE